jgi:hypothetical protein
MKILFTIILVLAVLYCGVGVVMAFYEHTQTDNPFNWRTILTWLPKIFK